MGKILRVDTTLANAYVGADFSPGLTDVYFEWCVYFPSATLDDPDVQANWLDVADLYDTTSGYLDGVFISFDNTPGSGWEWWTEFEPGAPAGTVTPDEWHTLRWRVQSDGSRLFEVDGVTLFDDVCPSTGPVGTFELGSDGFGAYPAVYYYDDAKAGSAAFGGSDFFSDDFESGGLSAWDTTAGDVSVVNDGVTGGGCSGGGGISVSASPSSLSILTGDSGTSTITVGGPAQSVDLTTSALPPGVTVGFATDPVSAPGTSVMTVTVAGGATSGTYTFNVVGTGASGTDSDVVTLTIFAGLNSTCAVALSIAGTSGSDLADNSVANGFDFATDPLFNEECWGLGYGGGGPLWWKYRNPFSRPVLLRVFLDPVASGIQRGLLGVFRGGCDALTTADLYPTSGDNRTWLGFTNDFLLSAFNPLDRCVDIAVSPGETVYVEADGYSGDSTDPVTLGAPNRGRFRLRWEVLSISVRDALEESVLVAEDNCSVAGDSYNEPTSASPATTGSNSSARPDDYIEFAGDSWFTTAIAPPHYPVSILDDFNRADENPLASNGWLSPFQDGVGPCFALKIAANKLLATNAGRNTALWPDLYTGDVEVGCTIAEPGTTERVYLHWDDATQTGYEAIWDVSGQVNIFLIDGTGPHLLFSGGAGAPQAGARMRFRFLASVGELTVRTLQPTAHFWTVSSSAIDTTYNNGMAGLGLTPAGAAGKLDDFSVITADFPVDSTPQVQRWDGTSVATYYLPVSGTWQEAEIMLNTDGADVWAVTMENGGPTGVGWPNPRAAEPGEPADWFPAYPVIFRYDAGLDEFVREGVMEPKTANVYAFGGLGATSYAGKVGSFDSTAHESMPGRCYVVWNEKGANTPIPGGTLGFYSNGQWLEHMAIGCFGSGAPFGEVDVGFSSTDLTEAVDNAGDGDSPVGTPPYWLERRGRVLLVNDQGVCQIFRAEAQPVVPGPAIGIDGPYQQDHILCEQVEEDGSLTLKQTIGYVKPPGSSLPAALGNEGYARSLAIEPVCHGEKPLDSSDVWGFVRQGDAFPGDHPDWTLLPALGVSGVLWLDTDPTFTGADLSATRGAGFKAGIWTNAGSGQSANSFATQASDLVGTYAPDLLVLDVETRYGTDPSANWTWHDDMVAAFRALQPTQAIAVTMGPIHGGDFNFAAYTDAGATVWPQSYPGDIADCGLYDPATVFDDVVTVGGVAPELVAPVLAAPCYQAHVAILAAAGHRRWSVFTLDDRPRPPSEVSAIPAEDLRTLFISWTIADYPGTPANTIALAYNVAPLLDVPERWYNDNAQANGLDVIITSVEAADMRRSLRRDRFGQTWAFVMGIAHVAVFFDRNCDRSWRPVNLPYSDEQAFLLGGSFLPNERMFSARQVTWHEDGDFVRTASAYDVGDGGATTTHTLVVSHMKVLRKWVICSVGAEVEDEISGTPFLNITFRARGFNTVPALYVLPGIWAGLVVVGNIDINHRTVVHNHDGSISTEESISVGDGGLEVLIPTVVGGVIVSNPAAIAHYGSTGQHLGKFDTIPHANAYAVALHERQDFFYHSPSAPPESPASLAAFPAVILDPIEFR